MAEQKPKDVACELFTRFDTNDLAGALALLSDDVRWRIAGNPEKVPVAGEHDKAGITRVLTSLVAQLEDGLRMTVTNAIAEGDQVALEVTSRGTLKNGRVYANAYHFLVEVREGRIERVHEYLDTQHVLETWFQ